MLLPPRKDGHFRTMLCYLVSLKWFKESPGFDAGGEDHRYQASNMGFKRGGGQTD